MKKIVDVRTALSKIPKGGRIFLGSGAAVPSALVDGLARNADLFTASELVHILFLGEAPFLEEKYSRSFQDNSFFIGSNVRPYVKSGRADYTPVFLSEIPRLFRSRALPLSAALISVSPPDKHGMCSLGVSVDVVLSALESADIVIAQVNHNMPHTFGRALIPFSEIDYVVEADTTLPEHGSSKVNDEQAAVFEAIGRNVASLIGDGCVLQMGIGAIPDAVLRFLRDKNDLGVHTEMFSDGLIPLIESGVVNNSTKEILKGRVLTSFAMGSRELYDYLDENSLIEFYPSDFVNDPFRIAQNDRMIAINSALQVDLTGQVCADSLGSTFFSGIGGQVDFIRGAARSRGGRPVIALPSTAKGGSISRIVARLDEAAGVVTTRGDVHYVVTEYGVARLYGRSIRQRALELIRISHPDFREKLLEEIKQERHIHFPSNLVSLEDNYMKEWEESLEFDEKEYKVRPLRMTDEKILKDFFAENHMSFDGLETMYAENLSMLVVEKNNENDEVVAMGRLKPISGRESAQLEIHHSQPMPDTLTSALVDKLLNKARDRSISGILVVCRKDQLAIKKGLDEQVKLLSGSHCRVDGDFYLYLLSLTGKMAASDGIFARCVNRYQKQIPQVDVENQSKI